MKYDGTASTTSQKCLIILFHHRSKRIFYDIGQTQGQCFGKVLQTILFRISVQFYRICDVIV